MPLHAGSLIPLVKTRDFGMTPGAYQVVTARRIHGKHCYYTREQVDFVATFVGTRDIWYIIPIEEIGTRRRVYLYPDGRRKSGSGIFEEFREAWHLLKGESPIGDISAASADGAALRWRILDLGVQEVAPR